MKTLLLFSLLLAGTAFHCVGQDSTGAHSIDRQLKRCTDADGSTVGLAECMKNAEHAWEAELNKD